MSDANASKVWNGLLILAAVAVASFVTIGILLMSGVFNPNTVSIETLQPDSAQTKSPAREASGAKFSQESHAVLGARNTTGLDAVFPEPAPPN